MEIFQLLGNQTWTCQADGTFTPTTPDRSGCVEPWIIDISEKVINLCYVQKAF